MRTYLKWAGRLFLAGLAMAVVGVLAIGIFLIRLSSDLPDLEALAVYEPPVMSRVHAGDGKVIAEYARQHRIFVPIAAIPKSVINAFVSAEDKTYYEHHGVDWKGVLRATRNNVINKILGRRMEGASTLTQQVAENFLVDTEQSYTKKIRKMIIATRIEKVFNKDQILELYLNEIYLGNRAYGVAAASLNYFGKSLDDLAVSEMAFLAALPKGPANYHPIRKKARAIARRNYVLQRMAANGYITEEVSIAAQEDDLVSIERLTGDKFEAAAYFVEAIRREVFSLYGEDQLYDGGLSIRTTLDTTMQQTARTALRDSLEEYDRRHGWRGPLQKIDLVAVDGDPLDELVKPRGTDADWVLAVVTTISAKTTRILMQNNQIGEIELSEVKWARKQLPQALLGPTIKNMHQVFSLGDVVMVKRLESEDDKSLYGLRQIPEVNGAIMAMDPHTGRVLAMVGGYSHKRSEFNRAIQARRQVGSSFKPFVYASALELDYTPVSLILDAPFIADGGADTRFYKPQNYESGAFYGLSTLRLGVEKSRNVMTVRLAQEMGMAPIVDIGIRMGIYDELLPVLAMSLGAGETTLWRLMGAYAALVNGGRLVTPTILDRVQDRNGKTILKHDTRDCPGCRVEVAPTSGRLVEPKLPDARPQVIDSTTAYQMVSILEGAVQRGTGIRLRSLGKTLGGKTGTTNDMKDGWFLGFSPDLVVGVYVGFDTPSTMGKGEAGSRVALPVFKRFMEKALENVPNAPFRIPDGVSLVWVDAKTGEIARPDQPGAIMEAFRPGTEPSTSNQGVRLSIAGAGISFGGGLPTQTPGAGTENGVQIANVEGKVGVDGQPIEPGAEPSPDDLEDAPLDDEELLDGVY